MQPVSTYCPAANAEEIKCVHTKIRCESSLAPVRLTQYPNIPGKSGEVTIKFV